MESTATTFMDATFFKFISSTFVNSIILCGGVIATLIAIRSAKNATISTITNSRNIAKQTETALMMFHSRTDDMLRAGYKTIRELHGSGGDNIVSYATDKAKRASDKNEQIRYVLNHWERIAVCVSHQIYCEEILKDSMYTTVVNVFEQAEPFIRALRKHAGTETIYQDLEKMVIRWKASPLKKR
jgi:hypothetical protein